MKIHVEPFGAVKGAQCQLYTITNARGAQVKLTNYSGAIVGLTAPDKKGRLDNVVLGFDDLKSYVKNPGYLGALIGPIGNRISGAAFTFHGADYAFTPNEHGETLLHSGDFGFHAFAWDGECEVGADAARVIFTRDFPHEDTGFPGSLRAKVTYSFDDACELKIEYDIETDSPSFVSPTNHAYFNLGGTGAKSVPTVERQSIQIFADHFTRVDDKTISIAAAPVEGTPLDLRTPVKIADGLAYEHTDEQLICGSGYDHNFILAGEPDPKTGLRLAARVTDDRTGRVMSVYTDMPCVQFYAANHLNRWNAKERRYYKARRALCLETQFAPDSIHHPNEFGFQIREVTPESPFHSVTIYAFDVK